MLTRKGCKVSDLKTVETGLNQCLGQIKKGQKRLNILARKDTFTIEVRSRPFLGRTSRNLSLLTDGGSSRRPRNWITDNFGQLLN